MNTIIEGLKRMTNMKRLTRTILLVGMLLGGVTVQGQQNYVFVYNNSDYIKNNGGTLESTSGFTPGAVWIASGDLGTTAQTVKSYTEQTKYLYYASSTSGDLSLSTNTANWYTRDSRLCSNRSNGNNRAYYPKDNGSNATISQGNSGNRYNYYTVSITPHDLVDNTSATVSVASHSGKTISFSHTNLSGTYTPAYTTYTFNYTTHNWYNDTDNGTSTPSAVNANTLNPTYTWSIQPEVSYASINSETGVLTLGANVTGNITVRLTVSNISPLGNKTVDFTLTRAAIAEDEDAVTTLTTPNINPASVALYYNEDGQEFTSSAMATTTTTTIPAHTTLTGGGNTYYYYNGTLYTSTDGFKTTEDSHPSVTLTWSLSGDAASYLTRTPSSGTSTTVTHTSQSPSDLTATLTVTASASGASNQTATATVTAYGPMVAPTITRTGNSISLSTTSTNASIYYTTDGTTPDATSGILYTGPFDLTTSPTTVKAITIRDTHSSAVAIEQLLMKLAAPIITIDGSGVATITAEAGATIHYTTDGTTPTSSSTSYPEEGVQLTNPQTIKAIAVKTGYITSEVASADFIESGLSGDLVILDDREDHSWAYYNKELDSPIRSWNPADVKITYYGNGTGNINTTNGTTPTSNTWTQSASTVKVGPSDDYNTFVYFKTLERLDGSTSDNPTGLCTYTTIPNPFSVRPTYQYATGDLNKYCGFYMWRIKDIKNGKIYDAATNGSQKTAWTSGNVTTANMLYAEGTYYFQPDDEYGMEVELEAMWARAYVVTCSTNNELSDAIARNTLQASVSYERNFVVLTGGTQTNSVSNTNQKPLTISSLYPDGTGTLSTSVYVACPFMAQNDTKFEHLYMVDGGSRTVYQYTRQMQYYYNNYYGWQDINSSSNGTIYEDFQIYGTGTTYQDGFNITTTSGNTYPGRYKYTYNGTTTSSGSATHIANTNKLVYGRGISHPSGGDNICVNIIKGVVSSVEDLDYNLRIESGSYNYITLTDGYYDIDDNSYSSGISLTGTVDIRATVGCDFDRGKYSANRGATDNLRVFYNMFVGVGTTISDDNINRDPVKIWVKSGKIGNGVTISNGHEASAHQTVYISVAGTSGKGNRTLYIEGGELASISGGIDSENQSSNSHVKSVTIRMTNGHVRGAIYGGGARSAASGDRYMIFTGGVVTGWIGAGCNGEAYPDGETSESTYGGITNGASYMYFGGDASCGGTGSGTLINGSAGGVIFGAGKGVEGNTTSGRMSYGTTVIIADVCDVERNVYGGGNFGYAQTSTNVIITGGTVHGSVFGGSNQNNGPVINITMKGGLVEKGLYGGCNTSGTISSNVTMQINGGQVGTDVNNTGNIHGGGYGPDTRVSGTIDLTLGAENQTTPGVTVYGDVYGGSALGHVNGTAVSSNHTWVTLNAGTINGSLYGGALGDLSSLGDGHSNVTANVYGPVKVTVNGGSVRKTDDNGANGSGGVYGCNNVNGAPQSSVAVVINGTDPAPAGDQYALFAVYGGGNAADYTGHGKPTVTVNNCDNSIENIYGGGNAAAVDSTYVTVYGGNIGRVFGGGNGESGTAANVNGKTKVYIAGGNIGQVFGGSNKTGTIGGTINVTVMKDITSECAMNINEVYGGGNEAPSRAGNVTIGCMGDDDIIEYVYGGANKANIGTDAQHSDITLNIKGGRINNVFGGNNTSGTIFGTITVDVDWTSSSCTNNYLGNVFGGGNLAEYSTLSGQSNFPVVTLTNGIVSGDVYGGGNGDPNDTEHPGQKGSVTGNPQVTIGAGTGQAIVRGNVYGGGNAAKINGNTFVQIKNKAKMFGNIYGGGNAAKVTGNTKVVVNGTITTP